MNFAAQSPKGTHAQAKEKAEGKRERFPLLFREEEEGTLLFGSTLGTTLLMNTAGQEKRAFNLDHVKAL